MHYPPQRMLQEMDSNVLNGIFEYFPFRLKFEILQHVCSYWHSITWSPECNSSLTLSPQKSAGDAAYQRRLFDYLYTHGVASLDNGLWSRLKHVKLVGMQTDRKGAFILEFLARQPILSHVELTRPSSQWLALFLAARPPRMSSLTLSEVEVETAADLCVFSNHDLLDLQLTDVFCVKDHSSTAVSPSLSFLDYSLPSWHPLQRLDLYIVPFSELLSFLNLALSGHRFDNLSFLKIRCLSSSHQADQLAALIDAKVPELGWSAMEHVEVGFATSDLVNALANKCSANSLRRVSFPSRLDVQVERDLLEFAVRFDNVSEVFIRVKSSQQLEDVAGVIGRTNWKNSIQLLKVTWSVINSISAAALIALQLAVGPLLQFKLTPRSLTLLPRQTSCSEETAPFEHFYTNMCKTRIVCECDECAYNGDPLEEHVLGLAQEEWDSLPPETRIQYLSTLEI